MGDVKHLYIGALADPSRQMFADGLPAMWFVETLAWVKQKSFRDKRVEGPGVVLPALSTGASNESRLIF